MRITINNYDNIKMKYVSDALFDIDISTLEKRKHYKSTYNDFNLEVYYRKTKNGYAIDLHKIKK